MTGAEGVQQKSTKGTILLWVKGASSRQPERSNYSWGPLPERWSWDSFFSLFLETVSVTVIYTCSPVSPGGEALWPHHVSVSKAPLGAFVPLAQGPWEHGALQHLVLLGAENINSCCQEDTERFSL